jgi:drug/metabolite transporter (DMT)-like permease
MRAEVKGSLYIASSSVLFAAMALGVRILSRQLSAGQIASVRFVLGILGGMALFGLMRQWPIIRRPWLWAARGLLGGLSAYFYFVSIQHLEVGPAAVLNNTAPAFASVFAFYYLRERVNAHVVLGLVVAMLGSAMVAYGTHQPGQAFALGLGVWAGLASAVLSGGAIVVMRALRRDTDALTVFLSFSVFGLLWSAPMALWERAPLPASDVWVPLLAVGVFSVAAQLLYTHGLGFVPVASGSVVNLLMPALTWMGAVAWLGESASPVSIWGALLSAAGVLWGSFGAPYLASLRTRPT